METGQTFWSIIGCFKKGKKAGTHTVAKLPQWGRGEEDAVKAHFGDTSRTKTLWPFLFAGWKHSKMELANTWVASEIAGGGGKGTRGGKKTGESRP